MKKFLRRLHCRFDFFFLAPEHKILFRKLKVDPDSLIAQGKI